MAFNRIDNGFEQANSSYDIELTNSISVFPNPISNRATVAINLVEASDVAIEVVDLSGRRVMYKEYAKQNGYFNIDFDATGLQSSVYIMKISTNDKYTTKRISVVK